MPSTDFKGTYTALATPFDQEKIDYKDLEALVEHQINGGITGPVSYTHLTLPTIYSV